jgi:hypothetical protein
MKLKSFPLSFTRAAVSAAAALFAVTSRAQSGGQFTLSGTIGQPDAGTLTGSSFRLEGGFWRFAPILGA